MASLRMQWPQDLKTPEVTYKRLGAKLVVGMPFKDIATADTLLMRSLPAKDDAAGRRALKRLQVRMTSYLMAHAVSCGMLPSAALSPLAPGPALNAEQAQPAVQIAGTLLQYTRAQALLIIIVSSTTCRLPVAETITLAGKLNWHMMGDMHASLAIIYSSLTRMIKHTGHLDFTFAS